MRLALPEERVDALGRRGIEQVLGHHLRGQLVGVLEARLEQLCDYTAMTRIRSESKQFRPDRAVANASAEPKETGNTLEVTGGAFRSRKKWYALSYICTASPDRMSVTAFRYKVGEEIPESKWSAYGLWD